MDNLTIYDIKENVFNTEEIIMLDREKFMRK